MGEDCDFAAKLLRDRKNKNNNIRNQNQKEIDRYNRDVAEFEKQKQARDKYINNRKSKLQNEIKHWKNCVPWNQARNETKNNWCVSDFGRGWYHERSKAKGCHPGFGRGACKRESWKVNEEAKKGAPNVRSYPDINRYNTKRQIDTSPIQINCCKNVNQLIGSTLENVQVNQSLNCNNEINGHPSAPPPPPPPPPPMGGKIVPVIPKIEAKEGIQNDKEYYALIGSSSLVLVLLMGSMFIV